MKTFQLIAVVLIFLGVLTLAYGGFTYSRETNEENLGSMSLAVDDRDRVYLPVLAGVGGILIGGLIFVFGRSPR